MRPWRARLSRAPVIGASPHFSKLPCLRTVIGVVIAGTSIYCTNCAGGCHGDTECNTKVRLRRLREPAPSVGLILDWASFVQAFCDLTAAIASLLLVFILIPLILCLLCGCGVFLCFCGGLAMCGLAASEAGDV